MCGARHRRHGDRRGYRWGRTHSEIGYHGGKVKVARPRVRDRAGKEVSLESWQALRDGILGFGVRIRPTGHKSYVYHRYAEGQSRRFTLGQVALGSVDEARRDCMEVWGIMQSGGRAEGADDAQAPLFRDFVAGSWRAAWYEPCKPSTKTSKDWALNNQLLPVFGAMPLDGIDRTGENGRAIIPH